MSTQDEFELELDNQGSDEQDGFDLGQNNQWEYDNDSQTKDKQNKSNWKKVTEKLKQKDAIIDELSNKTKELEESVRYLAQQTASLQSNGDYSEDTVRLNRMEQDLFLSKNPDASQHFVKITETQNKFYWMTLEDAWKFVKADLQPKSQESKSSNDFDFISETIKVKKTLAEVTPEEALKLPKDELYKWQKLHWYQS